MKRFFCALIFLVASLSAFGGDAAAFVDIGISEDGKTYVFGEYGMTDRNFQGYAEIYAVDIEKNDFLKNGVYRTKPSADTFSKSGKDVFDALMSRSSWWLRRFSCMPVPSDRVLYVADGKVSGDSEIIFKDAEGSTVEHSIFYHIRLVKTMENVISASSVPGGVRSSFFITLEKTDENGHVVSRNIVGSPDIKRDGVLDYKIDRIFTDGSSRNLIFVVEKIVSDPAGTSVRYMVETIRL